MLKKELEESYIRILQRELVPALGCTEPIALAYAAAKALPQSTGTVPGKNDCVLQR